MAITPPSTPPNEDLYLEDKPPYDYTGEGSPSPMGAVVDAYPEYSTTSWLDELRTTEYAYLDNQDHVYLDYTGSGLAAYGQYCAHEKRLASTPYGVWQPTLGEPHQ
jgi:hypothetical protein